VGIISGIIGIIVILLIAFLISSNKKSINYRTVIGAFSIQVLFAIFVLYVPFGQQVLGTMAQGVANAISAGKSGVEFVFGPLASGNIGFIFAVMVLAIVIFFASLISVLYYLKIMPLIINTIGYGIHKLLKTSKTESISATANIFVGQTEAPIVVKPYLNNLTKSELFAIMVGGLASVSGGVLAGYASLGIDIKYLIAASFMAAPGGLLMAKIIMPETETPALEIRENTEDSIRKPTNIIEAAASGASDGLHLVLNIGAMLIAFIGLVTLADIIVGYFGGLFGLKDFSFSVILGYIFSPMAFIIGVPWNEATQVGIFLGQKLIFNEFVAYVNLIKVLPDLTPKTQAIITFALCGFANISSVGILIGGLGTLAPKMRPLIAKYAVKAIAAGTLSNLMSATLAGLFLTF
jgi:CNT family concentrative nucleoside transporter